MPSRDERLNTKRMRLTGSEILVRLQAWQKVQKSVEAQSNALQTLTMASPESPLMNALWSTFSAYTEAVRELIGDQYDWMGWFWLECDMGVRPMEARVGEKKFRVKSLQHLAKVIVAHQSLAD